MIFIYTLLLVFGLMIALDFLIHGNTHTIDILLQISQTPGGWVLVLGSFVGVAVVVVFVLYPLTMYLIRNGGKHE